MIDSPGAKPFTANFQTDDYAAGVKLAKSAAAKIRASGQACAVGIIQGVSFVPILRARNAGLEAGAKAAGCKVLDKQVNTKDNVDTARAIVSTWRTKYGSQMTGILAINDPSALAALSAVSGSFKPLITGYNGDATNVDQIRKGSIHASAALLSPEIGNGMAYAAYQVLTGKKVPNTVAAPYFQLTGANVASYKSYDQRLKDADEGRVREAGQRLPPEDVARVAGAPRSVHREAVRRCHGARRGRPRGRPRRDRRARGRERLGQVDAREDPRRARSRRTRRRSSSTA